MRDYPSLFDERKTIVLIDLSGYIFRAYHAIEGLSTKTGFPTGVLYGVIRMLLKLRERYQDAWFIAVQDAPGPSWRKDLLPTYKAQRPPTPEPIKQQAPWVSELVEAFGIATFEESGQEADDLIAQLVDYFQPRHDIVIVSADKDLLQLVNSHVTMFDAMRDTVYDAKQVKEKWGVAPQQIPDVLTLIGDSSDNIPGVPGIGKKRAADLICQYGNLVNLLANSANLPAQKWAESLRQNIAVAQTSYQVIKLAPTPVAANKIEALAAHTPNVDKLKSLLNQFEFYSLLKQLPQLFHQFRHDASATTPALSEKTDQASLFWQQRHVHIITEITTLATILQAHEVCVDTETTSLDPHQAKLVGISFCANQTDAYYLPLGHTQGKNLPWSKVLPTVKAWAENPQQKKIGQNLKYDYNIFRKHGITLQGIAGDTMLASYLLGPDDRGHNLDTLAAKHLQHKTIAFKDVATDQHFEHVEIDKAAIYAGEDVLVAFALHEQFLPNLQDQQLLSVYHDIEIPLLQVLADMEWHGVLVDRQHLNKLQQIIEQRLLTLEEEIWQLAGRHFNIQSPKQISQILFEDLAISHKGIKKTKTGNYSTNIDALEDLKDTHPIVGKILEHRNLAKLLQTYVIGLLASISSTTGRVHPQFSQTIAATGRLSCSNPNLQNIPIRDAWSAQIRDAFIAPPGHTLICADYSQIELRILAHLSQDPGLLDAFANSQDVHARTAAEVFDVPLTAVTSVQRRQAKAINFGLMYGMGARRLASSLEISQDQAKEYLARYFNRYPGIERFRKQMIDDARRLGCTTTLFGRKRFIAELQSTSPRDIAQGERLAINSPIQGTAADIIKIAMIRLSARLKKELPTAKLILQVHDELIVEIPQEYQTQAKTILQEEMQQAADLCVPLHVDIGVGLTWSQAHG